MKILITGADGFIGSHMIEHVLANTSWDIVALCSWRIGGVAERIQAGQPRLRVVTHDLRAPLSKLAVGGLRDVDAIVHFAANSNVDHSITDPADVITNNVAATVNALELARELDVAAFVQISTDEVYGPAKDGYCHKEWDPILPSNPYSGSKAAQEAVAFSYWRTFGAPVIITNTMNNIGQRQSADKFLPMIIRKVLHGERLGIHAIGDKVGSRFYLHARNHADAICFLLKEHMVRCVPPSRPGYAAREEGLYPQADRPPRYHVVGEKELTNLELAQAVAGFVGKPLIYELVDAHSSRPGHDLRYALDGTKLAKAGWKAPVPLEDSIRKTVEWYLQHPEWLEV